MAEAELACGWWGSNRHNFGSSCSGCFTGLAVLTFVKEVSMADHLLYFHEVDPENAEV